MCWVNILSMSNLSDEDESMFPKGLDESSLNIFFNIIFIIIFLNISSFWTCCCCPPRTSCKAGCCCCPDICCMLFKAPITFICSMSWWLSSMAWTNLCGDLRKEKNINVKYENYWELYCITVISFEGKLKDAYLYIGRSSSGMSIPVHFTTAFFILSKEVFIMFSPKQDSMALCSAHCFCIFFIPNMSSPARATPTQIKIMKDLMMFWWSRYKKGFG